MTHHDTCETCDGRGTVTQDIDRHGRRYINQPVEERDHMCDDCDGTGQMTHERKWCDFHHHYEDDARCTCSKPAPADLPFPAPASSGEAATGEAVCQCGRRPDPGVCPDDDCPFGTPHGHCRCIAGHKGGA